MRHPRRVDKTCVTQEAGNKQASPIGRGVDLRHQHRVDLCHPEAVDLQHPEMGGYGESTVVGTKSLAASSCFPSA